MVRTQATPVTKSDIWSRNLLKGLDIAALGLAVTLVGLHEVEPLFAVIVGLFSLVAWMALSAPGYQVRRLTSRRLAAPMLGATGALLVMAVLRESYSGTKLATFALLWTLLMVAIRLTLPRFWPPIRVLLLTRSSAYDELKDRRGLDLVKRSTPPKSFEAWDVISFDGGPDVDPGVVRWLNQAAMAGYTIVGAHQLFEELTGKVPVEVLERNWVVSSLTRDRAYAPLKRFFDIVAVLLLLPALLPLCLIVAALVFIDAGRPILFWQDRVGLGGRPFRMVKFRTMRKDAESDGAAFAASEDARITNIGRVLRRFRLDELPQFWNVLRGEMSVIGPRPEQVTFAEDFDERFPLYSIRHAVLPGITGWAQVTQGYAAGADETLEKLRRDIYYIKHLSIGADIKVLLLTAATVLTGFGSR